MIGWREGVEMEREINSSGFRIYNPSKLMSLWLSFLIFKVEIMTVLIKCSEELMH